MLAFSVRRRFLFVFEFLTVLLNILRAKIAFKVCFFSSLPLSYLTTSYFTLSLRSSGHNLVQERDSYEVDYRVGEKKCFSMQESLSANYAKIFL